MTHFNLNDDTLEGFRHRGGMFLVPINAALENIGHRTIGSGRAVALQSFLRMLRC